MKRLTFIFMVLFSVIIGKAQDLQRFSERDNLGTARYVGMAGAMTAVGGDPSAIADNPAGVGIYRRFEVMVTFNEKLDYTRQIGSGCDNIMKFSVPNVSLIYSFGNNGQTSGLIYNNLSFSFARKKDFSRVTVSGGKNQQMSLVDQICNMTQGLPYSAFGSDAEPFSNEDIGWLSVFGFNTYLIDPVDSIKTWKSVLKNGELFNSRMNIDENGYLDEFNATWGGNVGNRWYFGLGLNVRTMSYSKSMSYSEAYERGGNMQLKSYISQSGVGVNGIFGMMIHPIRHLRLGVSIQTPSSLALTTKTEGLMETDGFAKDGEGKTLKVKTNASISGLESSLVMPMRLTTGAAVIFDKGLLSIEYDYAHHKTITDVHTFKFGSEIIMAGCLFMNAGYAFETSFYTKGEPMVPIEINSVRTDPDFRNMRLTHMAGFAFGYRGNYMIAQLGYQFRWQAYDQYPFCTKIYSSGYIDAPKPFDMESMTHNIVLTLGWHAHK